MFEIVLGAVGVLTVTFLCIVGLVTLNHGLNGYEFYKIVEIEKLKEKAKGKRR